MPFISEPAASPSPSTRRVRASSGSAVRGGAGSTDGIGELPPVDDRGRERARALCVRAWRACVRACVRVYCARDRFVFR